LRIKKAGTGCAALLICAGLQDGGTEGSREGKGKGKGEVMGSGEREAGVGL
jgi:hypothetical protein